MGISSDHAVLVMQESTEGNSRIHLAGSGSQQILLNGHQELSLVFGHYKIEGSPSQDVEINHQKRMPQTKPNP